MIFLRIEERVFERPLGFGSYCQLPHYCWPGTFVFGNCMWHVLHLTGLSVGVAGAGFGCDWHQHLAASTFVAFNYFFDMRMPPTWTHSPTMVYWIQASFLFLPTCWPYSFKPEKSVRHQHVAATRNTLTGNLISPHLWGLCFRCLFQLVQDDPLTHK